MSKFKNQPILVHCSAGIGRTGTLIAIDYCREALRANGEGEGEGSPTQTPVQVQGGGGLIPPSLPI